MNRQFTIAAAILLVIAAGIIYFTKPENTSPTENNGQNQAVARVYQNSIHGYSLSHSSNLNTEEFSPDHVVFARSSGDSVNAVAESRVIGVQGRPGEGFAQAVGRELVELCTEQQASGNFNCEGVERYSTFQTNSGTIGTVIYLKGQEKNSQDGQTKAGARGPFYAIPLQTSATASKVIVVHPPLNQDPGQVNISEVEAIAKTVQIEEPAGDTTGDRHMDIESYISNNISELSPVKEQVGGKFFVTKIEVADGKGTVEYEDGHNAYVADFTYRVDQNGKPEVLSFKVRE